GDLRDQRDEAMPERERVAGMEPAVLELVERAKVQAAEIDELAHAREVEQSVPGDRARDVPQCDAEDDAAEEDEPAEARGRARRPDAAPGAADKRDEADRTEQRQRERDVAVNGEDDRPGGEDRRETEDERRGGRAPAEGTRDEPAGQQHDG